MINCQFCSVIAKSNGEDPIGTANSSDRWLIMELPQPWTEERFHHDPILKPIHDLFHQLFNQGVKVSPMAIASDHEYSQSEFSRIIHYQKFNLSFSSFIKEEYLIPDDQRWDLIKNLCHQPPELENFRNYKLSDVVDRDMMVCTHGNIDIACSRFGYSIYKQLRQKYASKNLRVWRCSHFGGHQFAPTLIDFPNGQVWGHLESEILDNLVRREGQVKQLYKFYRGWAGVTKFAQIVEREIWIERGWQWLNYQKSAQILNMDDNQPDPNWVEVQFDFISPDKIKGAYFARVETTGSVMTARNSGDELISVKQYSVSYLKEIDK
ncbi:sucrase ferredoxin [Synechocystis sp. PCC 7339]|uniref:sucrase ferredoxin n=1 Tax=unclassified Synechocystis TaxID=2640012 RepID=UPI001BAF70C9|nr:MULTISPECIES: sucrase ferredoxin [unclassified Synechocystis]QUS60320.1 sucrase ferredoxin [Synechocystis sp. PCC 7338]UAJ72232.1 sucrase ferredoxin [Synechocystis sp. PCC 7339]